MHIQLRHLHYFVAVAEELNFRRAAEKVFVSQPALSAQIAQLEELIGVSLFVRDKRHVELTDQGKILYREARKIIRRVDRAIARVRESADIQPIRVGMPNFHHFEVLSQSLRRYTADYPGIDIEIHEQDALDMQSALLHREIDVGFMTLPLPTKEANALKSVLICSERLLLCVPPSHAAYDAEVVSSALVKGDTFFLTQRDHHPAWHDFIVNSLKKAGFEFDFRAEATSAQAQHSLVAAGRGLCLAPESSPLPQDLRAIPFDIPAFELELAVVWHPEKTHPSTNTLIESMIP